MQAPGAPSLPDLRCQLSPLRSEKAPPSPPPAGQGAAPPGTEKTGHRPTQNPAHLTMSSAGCVSQRQNPGWSRFWISTGDSLLPHKRPLCVCTLSRFSRVQHFVTPMDCSPPDSPVHGILQAKTLDCVAIPSFRGSSDPGIKPMSPASIGKRTLYHCCCCC